MAACPMPDALGPEGLALSTLARGNLFSEASSCPPPPGAEPAEASSAAY